MSALAMGWFGSFGRDGKTNAEGAVVAEVCVAEWSEEMTLGELLFYALVEAVE